MEAVGDLASLPQQGSEMDVEYGVPFHVAFKSGYPGFGAIVNDTLDAAHATIQALFERLERFA